MQRRFYFLKNIIDKLVGNKFILIRMVDIIAVIRDIMDIAIAVWDGC